MTEPYSGDTLRELLQDNKIEEAKAYILSYHFKIGSGRSVAFLESDTVEMLTMTEL